jgi:transposase-like protein
MKRHDFEEIATKLRVAHDMMQTGKSQKEACEALGISVMTFHRWRKLAAAADVGLPQVADEERENAISPNGSTHSSQLDDLKLENQRLRRIVSDLLLEKMKVQEALEKAKR